MASVAVRAGLLQDTTSVATATVPEKHGSIAGETCKGG